MGKTKSYEISKQVVLEAFRRVKANRGAAGIDDESLEAFQANLKNNLYRIWNRMPSGSYFPPAVEAVGFGVSILRGIETHQEPCT